MLLVNPAIFTTAPLSVVAGDAMDTVPLEAMRIAGALSLT